MQGSTHWRFWLMVGSNSGSTPQCDLTLSQPWVGISFPQSFTMWRGRLDTYVTCVSNTLQNDLSLVHTPGRLKAGMFCQQFCQMKKSIPWYVCECVEHLDVRGIFCQIKNVEYYVHILCCVFLSTIRILKICWHPHVFLILFYGIHFQTPELNMDHKTPVVVSFEITIIILRWMPRISLHVSGRLILSDYPSLSHSPTLSLSHSYSPTILFFFTLSLFLSLSLILSDSHSLFYSLTLPLSHPYSLTTLLSSTLSLFHSLTHIIWLSFSLSLMHFLTLSLILSDSPSLFHSLNLSLSHSCSLTILLYFNLS